MIHIQVEVVPNQDELEKEEEVNMLKVGSRRGSEVRGYLKSSPNVRWVIVHLFVEHISPKII